MCPEMLLIEINSHRVNIQHKAGWSGIGLYTTICGASMLCSIHELHLNCLVFATEKLGNSVNRV